jgi:hypothetical protein
MINLNLILCAKFIKIDQRYIDISYLLVSNCKEREVGFKATSHYKIEIEKPPSDLC